MPGSPREFRIALRKFALTRLSYDADHCGSSYRLATDDRALRPPRSGEGAFEPLGGSKKNSDM
jgi:hypothetical protein